MYKENEKQNNSIMHIHCFESCDICRYYEKKDIFSDSNQCKYLNPKNNFCTCLIAQYETILTCLFNRYKEKHDHAGMLAESINNNLGEIKVLKSEVKTKDNQVNQKEYNFKRLWDTYRTTKDQLNETIESNEKLIKLINKLQKEIKQMKANKKATSKTTAAKKTTSKKPAAKKTPGKQTAVKKTVSKKATMKKGKKK